MSFSINGTTEKIYKSRTLFEHFKTLAAFVVRTCDREQNPTIVYFLLLRNISNLVSIYFSTSLLSIIAMKHAEIH